VSEKKAPMIKPEGNLLEKSKLNPESSARKRPPLNVRRTVILVRDNINLYGQL